MPQAEGRNFQYKHLITPMGLHLLPPLGLSGRAQEWRQASAVRSHIASLYLWMPRLTVTPQPKTTAPERALLHSAHSLTVPKPSSLLTLGPQVPSLVALGGFLNPVQHLIYTFTSNRPVVCHLFSAGRTGTNAAVNMVQPYQVSYLTCLTPITSSINGAAMGINQYDLQAAPPHTASSTQANRHGCYCCREGGGYY